LEIHASEIAAATRAQRYHIARGMIGSMKPPMKVEISYRTIAGRVWTYFGFEYLSDSAALDVLALAQKAGCSGCRVGEVEGLFRAKFRFNDRAEAALRKALTESRLCHKPRPYLESEIVVVEL
jgi:hypothetical protein